MEKLVDPSKKLDPNFKETTIKDFWRKIFEIDGKKVRVHLIDTAGQEKYKAVVSNAIKDCNGIILVYAVNDYESF